jgi:hypothetical protein
MSNPAIHYRRGTDFYQVDWVDAAFEHKSNGQVVEANINWDWLGAYTLVAPKQQLFSARP